MRIAPNRIPRDNLVVAQTLIEMANDPLPPSAVAFSDQTRAFHSDVTPRMRQAAQAHDASYHDVALSVEALAWELAVFAAVRARARFCCAHRTGELQTSDPLWTDISLGITACEACYAASVETLVAVHGGVMPDDGRCDICDAETRLFTPFMAQLGLWMVTGHQCDGCAAYSTELGQ